MGSQMHGIERSRGLSSGLVIRALVEFMRFDITRQRRGYNAVRACVMRTSEARGVRADSSANAGAKADASGGANASAGAGPGAGAGAAEEDIAAVSRAVQTACTLYFRTPYCLQRSFAVTRILRRRGVKASLVVGFKPAPLRAHAWVEVDGRIVSDVEENHEFYRELDRW